jgi:hypothetical protein
LPIAAVLKIMSVWHARIDHMTNGTVTGIRGALAMRAALESVGLGRTSKLSGGQVTGWIPTNHYGSTGFSLKPVANGNIDWHLVISGKPHMRYREYREMNGDDDTIDLHEPVNPEVVFPKIRQAFASLGVTVKDLSFGGAQLHWDDDVSYNVTTDKPEWLGIYDPKNHPPRTSDEPHLVSALLEHMPGLGQLLVPAYTLPGRILGVTREAADLMIETIATERRWDDLPTGTASFDENGVLVLDRKGRTGPSGFRRGPSPPSHLNERIAPVDIVNHWGDEVTVWRIPAAWATPTHGFSTTLPVLIAGEMVESPSFGLIDAQHGDGAPWHVEPERPEPVLAPAGPRP